jgi:hypothetical protein
MRPKLENQKRKTISMKNSKTKNSSSKPAVKSIAKSAVKKPTTKPAPKKKAATAKSAVRPRFTIFGEKSATSVVRALGKLNWKPADAIKAMGKLAPKLSAVAIRNSLFVGRHGKGAAPATLARTELAQLKRLAA